MRLILSDSYKCTRCGLQNPPGTTHCGACGLELGGQATPDPAQHTLVPATPKIPAASSQISNQTTATTTSPVAVAIASTAKPSFREWLGWRSVDGTVIQVGPSHLTPRRRRWWKVVLWLGLVALIVYGAILGIKAAAALAANAVTHSLPLIIIVILLALAMRAALRFLGLGQSGRGGFISNVASQFTGFFLTSRLLGQRPTIPVCDYRVRDSKGDEHLVRVEGYVQTGAMSVGDDVLVEGYDRGGTLVLKRGWNKRVRTAIKVKH